MPARPLAARKLLALAAAAAMVATVTGCDSAGSPEPPAPAAAAGTGAEGRTGYPLTFSNCGKEYTFSKAPGRVVVMNGGSVAEISTLLELGLGDRIIANAQSYGASEVPGRVEAIKAVPTGGIALNNLQDIPREAMLSMRPDFVISTYDGGFSADSGFATRDELLKAGANTYAPASACGTAGTVTGTPTIKDSYALLRDLGKIFDVSGRAERIIEQSRSAIDGMAAKMQGKPAERALVIFPGMGADDLSSIAANGIWNDVLAKAGAVNAFAGATGDVFATISKEQAATESIDVVVVVNYMNPDPQATVRKLFEQFPQWQAARDNRAVVLSDSIYLGPSNHLAVELIAKAVHPDSFS